jgi:hypothetical protein
MQKKTLEDAIFNANDSYEEIEAENKNLRKELQGTALFILIVV